MNESENKKKCKICNSECNAYPDYDKDKVFYTCPVCGRYELTLEFPKSKVNLNHLAAYLCHNRFERKLDEYRYNTFLDKGICDTYKEKFNKGDISNGLPVHIDAEIVENWYPKSFSERVDKILLYLNSKTKHVGQQVLLSYQEALSAFFIDRKELEEYSMYSPDWKERDSDECADELKYILDYLNDCNYIKHITCVDDEDSILISLLPDGYARVDELQKNTTVHGKNAFVAMQFGNETAVLREAIRKGITDAGYIAIFIDEVQHNDFITPEILKHIRDSKFVVVDLTQENRGAYFEEGYAMGLGKTVIQLCSTKTQLHFDIAQKNTIMWETENDIPEKLKNRIKATID